MMRFAYPNPERDRLQWLQVPNEAISDSNSCDNSSPFDNNTTSHMKEIVSYDDEVWTMDKEIFTKTEAFLLSIYRMFRSVYVSSREGKPTHSNTNAASSLLSSTVPAEFLDINDIICLLSNAKRRYDALAAENILWHVWMSSNKSDVAALLREGVSNLNRGNHERAKELFHQVVIIDDENAEAMNKLAALYSSENNYEKCSEWAEKALVHNPKHFGAHTGLGLALEKQGQIFQAIESFKNALKLHPWAANVPTILSSLTFKVENEKKDKG
jgi:tetratricopeptide (TPR) repeat protein